MKYKHLISVDDLTDAEVLKICGAALKGVPRPKTAASPKTPIALVFAETSTRTRCSFERAAQVLNRKYILVDAASSSIAKGESLRDTLLCLKQYGCGSFVVRHAQNGALRALAEENIGNLVNAGEGTLEHPTQALLDLTTLLELVGSAKKLKGLKIGLLGDLKHSRVAHSFAKLAPRFGVELRLLSPSAWKPDWSADFDWSDRKDFSGLHTVMALRVQKERIQGLGAETLTHFQKNFQITAKDLNQHYLMHPGPVNWGVELAEGLENYEKSLILRQMHLGWRVRVQVLDRCP